MNQKGFAFVLSFTLFTIVAWIGFEVYHIRRVKIAAPILAEIEPLDPTLDLGLLKKLKDRPSYVGSVPREILSPPTSQANQTATRTSLASTGARP